VSTRYLCVHGHFYQPPREDPWTGQVRREVEAAPFHDFNEKITAECYRPNAERGSFARLSFDLGPTLAGWLDGHASETLRLIQAAEREHTLRFGASNALALPYNHTILPLANRREKQVQIAWGMTDYLFRFGHAPEGMWLPETAVDLATLRLLADAGIRYTILAPWQAEGPINPSEPYWVDLGDGRVLAAFFYHAPLSGSISFDPHMTANADQFCAAALPPALSREQDARDQPPIVLVATDGELYGHHQPFRDQFLARLLQESAPANGWTVTSLGAYLRRYPPRAVVGIRERTSWSCVHGLARWQTGCGCTDGPSNWKQPLRQALDGLAERLDQLYGQEVGRLVPDPWAVLAGYPAVRLGQDAMPALLQRHMPGSADAVATVERWLELQYCRQLMLTSCGMFFEDLARVEPRNSIAFAARALSLLPDRWRQRLEQDFVQTLQGARSWRTGQTGADLYRALVLTAPGNSCTFIDPSPARAAARPAS
jgi:alpha-amylase/alpha-mannosidase (GH57 family)